MFDFAWSEIALIAIVALIAIGPKDLPVAMKAISQMVKKARRMAGEFQTHVDEMVRDANLNEVRDQFNEIRRMDIKGSILKAVDDDGSLRSGLSKPTMDFSPAPPPVPVHDGVAAPDSLIADSLIADPLIAVPETAVAERVEHSIASPDPFPAEPAPAFIPPAYAPTQAVQVRAAPAFIPPAFIPEHA